jgi:hypothetical protein
MGNTERIEALEYVRSKGSHGDNALYVSLY